MPRRLLVLALLAAATVAAGQQPQRLPLTVDTIMRGPGLYGYTPRTVRWAPDGSHVYFQWKQHSDAVEADYDVYVVARDGSGLRKLTAEEAKDAPPMTAASWSRDRKRALYIDDGDVQLYEGMKRRTLTRTNAVESMPRFTQDEKSVTFVRENNLYVLSLTDGSLVQKTNIVRADERGPHVALFDTPKRTKSQEWVSAEAKKLSDVVARRAAEKEEDDAERKKEIGVKPLKLEPRQVATDLYLTADGKYVIAFFSAESDRGKRTIVPTYVTESGYTEDLNAREKVGDELSASKVATISTTDGSVKWLEHGLKGKLPAAEAAKKGETQAVGQSKTEAQRSESTVEKTEKREPPARDIRMGNLIVSEDGQKIVLPVRAADNKDWWLLALDPATAKTRVLYNEHDEAWVRWPFGVFGGFLRDHETLWFLSEQTGWMHLYTVPFSAGKARALTSGKWEITEVTPSRNRDAFFINANADSHHEWHLYRVPLSGGAPQKLTTGTGIHDVTVSPDDAAFADVFSYTNRPPELFVGGKRVTTSPAPDFASYPWQDVPIVTFKSRDGSDVPARLFKPANWNGGPAVIFVHGAGYLQNVHRGWSSYTREFLFHHLLNERGYLVLDIDFRASSGYGRDWRTGIYRHMGGKDLEDHVDGAKWLAREHRVDPKRIGIYGGSYGGFITLMALFTTPDVFASGAALRPVTDWAHYNHGYTSNILNTPQDDPEAYRKSSPIYFVEGLKGSLLICHGLIDVNVHAQDSIRLAQRLIELRKEKWELALYPLEDHTFVEPTSWADEYKRILKLFEETLK